MPLCPAWALMKSPTCLPLVDFACIARRKFGRSKPCTNTAGGRLEKLLQNIRTRGGVGGGGEGDRLHAVERSLHRAERGVFGAKIVAPLRDAMRLVDRQHRDLARA